MTLTDEQLENLIASFTPDQQIKLEFWEKKPWSWFVSNTRYTGWIRQFKAEADARAEAARQIAEEEAEERRFNEQAWANAEQARLEQDAVNKQRSYLSLINRCTTYAGPDWRVRIPGQKTMIRATQLQWEQAGNLGFERNTLELADA